MPYESVDQLQKILTEDVFHYAQDSKKAAGRALGTIVEIITFYLLKSWGLTESISIERRIPEFGNSDITHNVEFSLHPVYKKHPLTLVNDHRSITANRLLKALQPSLGGEAFEKLNNTLLTKDGVLRNACTIARNSDSRLVASIEKFDESSVVVSVAQQGIKPYAIFECKRVGVEEGSRKGPQTIEKAKQGAYVAKSVSSLQKVRLESGELFGVIYLDDKVLYSEPYHILLKRIVDSDDSRLLRNFVLTVGIVSNHGNWFTSENQNKELRVLAQSYDWLIFLSDDGITEFVQEIILHPDSRYQGIREAFIASYAPGKTKNRFTKVRMDFDADRQLLEYFARNDERIAKWFNVISPSAGSLRQLRNDISALHNKTWREILK
jgi:hypothetical protein